MASVVGYAVLVFPCFFFFASGMRGILWRCSLLRNSVRGGGKLVISCTQPMVKIRSHSSCRHEEYVGMGGPPYTEKLLVNLLILEIRLLCGTWTRMSATAWPSFGWEAAVSYSSCCALLRANNNKSAGLIVVVFCGLGIFDL